VDKTGLDVSKPGQKYKIFFFYPINLKKHFASSICSKSVILQLPLSADYNNIGFGKIVYSVLSGLI
jgi:hypothetical protein